MKILIAAAFALAVTGGMMASTAAQAQVHIGIGVHPVRYHGGHYRHHRHQVCHWRHHHRVCHWR